MISLIISVESFFFVRSNCSSPCHTHLHGTFVWLIVITTIIIATPLLLHLCHCTFAVHVNNLFHLKHSVPPLPDWPHHFYCSVGKQFNSISLGLVRRFRLCFSQKVLCISKIFCLCFQPCWNNLLCVSV